MFVLAVIVTVVLLAESLPSAVAGLVRSTAGVTRLDGLTRLGLLEGRHQRVVPVLGAIHLAGTAGAIAGIGVPVAGVPGAGIEAVVFGWVLSRQVRGGDRGRVLGAYTLFLVMALAVVAVDAARI